MNIKIVLGVIAVLFIIVFQVPLTWVALTFFIVLIAVTFNPFKLSAYTVPRGYVERQFDTGEVVLNYVEGPNNGPAILFIPGQSEFWQGYELVMPSFTRDYHVFAVDVRGHGKSTRTPGKYNYNIIGQDLRYSWRMSLRSLR